MRIGRRIVIPFILALGLAAAGAASSEMAAAAHGNGAQVHSVAVYSNPATFYRG